MAVRRILSLQNGLKTRANEYIRAYCDQEGFKRSSIDNIEPGPASSV